VSRETVLRRFLDRGRVPSSIYEELTQKWNKEFESRSKGSGGDYYATRASYLGDKYLGLAFGRYHQGAVSEQRLAEMLGVKARNIPNLEQQYLRRVSG
jgi:Zn-dependent peptidase ImmA (M78 family)